MLIVPSSTILDHKQAFYVTEMFCYFSKEHIVPEPLTDSKLALFLRWFNTSPHGIKKDNGKDPAKILDCYNVIKSWWLEQRYIEQCCPATEGDLTNLPPPINPFGPRTQAIIDELQKAVDALDQTELRSRLAKKSLKSSLRSPSPYTKGQLLKLAMAALSKNSFSGDRNRAFLAFEYSTAMPFENAMNIRLDQVRYATVNRQNAVG